MGNGSDDDESRADFNSSDSFSRHHPVASSLLQVHSVHSGSEADDSSTADHKQKRPYVCDVPGCDKSYTKHSHLVRHKVETHKMQKPEPKQRGAGTNFIPPPPINLVDRPYVCDYPGCRWSFKRQYHLDRHYMTHRLSLPKSDGEGSLDSSSAGGKLIIDSGFTDEDNDCGLSSPNMAASSTKRKYSCPESKGFSLLLSPDSASPKTETVPTKFNWPQLLKEKLFPCEHPNCDLRFKNQAMADQHYRMTHSGSSSSNNGFAIKQEPLDAMTLQSQLQRVIALTALGQQRSSPTLPGESLLKKTRTEKGLDLSEQANFSSFTQLKLLQALTRGSANNNQSPKFPAQTSNIHVSLDGQEEEETHITGSSDNLVDDENELLVRNSSWIAKQRKPREKGIFPCDIPGCDKKFGRNCELTRHKLNHMDIWPFSCDWPGCGRKFKRKDVFKNHQRTHRKEEDGTSIGQDEEVDDEPNESCNTNIESKTSSLQDERLGRCNQVLIEGDVDEDGDISDKE
ncbi:Transcription factor Sp9 [Halotydeus destructor]|nr:Transcription factor Sp9 [Halotydeus destructor]